MVDDDNLSPADIRRTADQALNLQEYILRRAWGLVYGITAAIIAVVLFLPVVARAVGLSEAYGLLPRIVVNTSESQVGSADEIWMLESIM